MFKKALDLVKGLLSSDTGKKSTVIGEVLELFKGKERLKIEFEQKMAILLSEKFEKELQDLQSARNMQIEALKQPDTFAKRFLYYVTIFLLALFAITHILPMFIVFPEENLSMIERSKDYINMTLIARIAAFFFGAKFNQNKTS